MSRKWFAQLAVAPCAFALAFGLFACSDDSSGTNAHIDTGDEISFNIPTGNGSSSSASEKTSSSGSAEPESSASENAFFNEGWREDCLAKINEYRATEDMPPLTLAAEEKQTCTDDEAAADLASGKAHGHFGDCGESAQNSGPNFTASWLKNATGVSDYYLEMMWSEKQLVESGKADLNSAADFSKIGHYKNMRSASYTKVACGIALSADGKTGWFNVNFF
ncbi:Cysteine-rich secretory protein family protein [Fibrobacter sp. UWH4]|nr:Cysteine-rich secretory protein family protein [Fibrobacter sp. UWH4]